MLDLDSPTLGALFTGLKKNWHVIPKQRITVLNGLTGAALKLKTDSISFLKSVKRNNLIRGDYRELVELSLIVLGELNEVGGSSYKYKSPGGLSNARWMAKALYALKLFLFQKQLGLDKMLVKSVNKFVKFVVLVYVKEWMTASFPEEAAVSDIR